MEILVEQPSAEQSRSFDIMASVHMFRYDLEHFGQVLPETRQRVCDEELSCIAEGIDRASRTSFVLAKEGDDLVYFDRGRWRSYTGMLLTGRDVAHTEAAEDYRTQFKADWADRDLAIGYKLRALQPGETLVWTNGYPHEIAEKYGADFIEKSGLSAHRKMGFVYRAQCLEDGSVVLESQTLDQSSAVGFKAIEERMQTDPSATLDELVSLYDQAIMDQTGQWVYAGRTEAARNENVWQEILAHRDLIDYMIDGLEKIAAEDVPEAQRKSRTTQHIVGVWKALKLRIERQHPVPITPRREGGVHAALYFEVSQAYTAAKVEGDIKFGCGGVVKVEDGPAGGASDFDAKGTFDSIFGSDNSESKSDWKWKDGVCRVEACPTRPGKTKVGPCAVCVRCQAKFDAGQDPTKVTASSESDTDAPTFDVYSELAKLFKQVTPETERVPEQKIAA